MSDRSAVLRADLMGFTVTIGGISLRVPLIRRTVDE